MTTPATHLMTPSTARRVVVDGFVPVPRGSDAGAVPTLVWPTKDPADVLDYTFDIAPALLGSSQDAVATLDVSISPANAGDLALNASSADGSQAVLWLAGGIAGTTYAVTIAIGTEEGRTLSRVVLLPVASLSAAANAPGSLTTDGGATLTDQGGNPIVLG